MSSPISAARRKRASIEPLKLWGHIEGDEIVEATTPSITTQCLRVPVSDGHMAAVFMSFAHKPSIEQIRKAWAEFRGPAQELELPSAPKQFLHYFEETDRPQTKLRPQPGKRHGRLHRPPASRTRSTTINLSASRTTRCAARQAAAF